MKKLLTPVGARFMLKVCAVAIGLQLVLSYVFGWTLASLVLAAAYVGFTVGQGRGFKHGLDTGYRNWLRAELAKIEAIEGEAVEEFAADHPARRQLAEAKAFLAREIANIR